MRAPAAPARQKFCRACGNPGPFETPRKLLCDNCRVDAAEERTGYDRTYQKCRSWAVSRLVDEHYEEFKELLAAECQSAGIAPRGKKIAPYPNAVIVRSKIKKAG